MSNKGIAGKISITIELPSGKKYSKGVYITNQQIADVGPLSLVHKVMSQLSGPVGLMLHEVMKEYNGVDYRRNRNPGKDSAGVQGSPQAGQKPLAL